MAGIMINYSQNKKQLERLRTKWILREAIVQYADEHLPADELIHTVMTSNQNKLRINLPK